MKTTLITGAASGLGREFSYLFAKDGNNLLLIDIHKEGLEKTKQEIQKINHSIHIDLLEADLSDLTSYKKIYAYTKENNYFINYLVNCAGFGDCCDIDKMNIDKQLTMTNVDCNALLYFTKVFLDDMLVRNEGHIINISSIAGFMPGPYMCTYHACKSYVLLLGEAISYEIRKTNVKLLTLCPGPFISSFVKEAHNDYTFTKITPVSAKAVAVTKNLKKEKKLLLLDLKINLLFSPLDFFPVPLLLQLVLKILKSIHNKNQSITHMVDWFYLYKIKTHIPNISYLYFFFTC